MDPQGNATIAVGGMATESPQSFDKKSPFAALKELKDGLWCLPSPGAKRNLSAATKPDFDKLEHLKAALAEQGVDWLVVDCPPRMDAWGWTGLRLCEEVLLPVQAEFFSMHGLSQMMQTLEESRRQFPGTAGLMGVLITMLDTREPVSLEVIEDLRGNLGDSVFEAMIYRDGQFVEAASYGLTLFDYNLDTKGAHSYGELVREVKHGRA